VPTATFRVLFVFVILSHARRSIVHVNVTGHPTAAWTAQPLRDAWSDDTAPRFLLRDRDRIYAPDVRRTVNAFGVKDVVTAPHAPWQNPFVERLIGSLRRECLDHVIVWNERARRRHLRQYVTDYRGVSTRDTNRVEGGEPAPHTFGAARGARRRRRSEPSFRGGSSFWQGQPSA